MAETVGALIIAGVTAAEGGSIFAIGGTTGLSFAGIGISAATAGSVALAVGAIGLNYALSPQAKQPKPADGLASIRQTNPIRQGGYGRCRVAGSYMLYEGGVGGPTGYQSIDVLALISGRICNVSGFYLNDDPVGIGTVLSGGADGRYLEGGFPRIQTDFRLGLATETAYSGAGAGFPFLWTGDHRGDGIASMELVCAQAADVEHQTRVYPNGLPQPTAVCDLYPIWDPRDDTQDPDDPATWIAATAWSSGTTYAARDRVTYDGVPFYSQVGGNLNNQPDSSPDKWACVLSNPVLQLIDYLTHADHGMGLDREILIDPVIDALMEQADLCDALVIDANGDYGPRYTSAGKFNFDDDPADVIGAILATCDGWLTEDGDGTLTTSVGVYAEPTLVLRGRHIVGFSISYGTADDQVVNELTLTFTSPGHNYQEVAGQAWRDEDDISQRGLLRSKPLALKWVQRHSQTRRLAKRAMARLSAGHGSLTTTLYGLRAIGKRWVKIAYPFPQMGTDDEPAVIELADGKIDFMAGTVTFNWTLVDPDTIDAWDPDTEEGDAPPIVA